MTKTKKSHQGQANRETSRIVALSHADTAVAQANDQSQQSESRECREQSIDDFDMAIRELAYLKWEAAGSPAGDGLDFWLEAERESKANRPASDTTPE